MFCIVRRLLFFLIIWRLEQVSLLTKVTDEAARAGMNPGDVFFPPHWNEFTCFLGLQTGKMSAQSLHQDNSLSPASEAQTGSCLPLKVFKTDR